MFLLGATGDKEQEIFSAEKQIVLNMIDLVSVPSTNIGVVIYGSNNYVAIPFGQYVQSSELKKQIANLRVYSSNANKGNIIMPLTLGYKQLTSTSSNVLVLFVNQKPIKKEIDFVRSIQDQGVKVVVIGMGNEVSSKDLIDLTGKKNDIVLVPNINNISVDTSKEIAAVIKPGISDVITQKFCR